MIKIGSLAFFGLFFLVGVVRAEITVQSLVDRNQVALGESLRVTVQIVTDQRVNIGEPRVPQLDGFDLLNTSQSSSTRSSMEATSSGTRFRTVRQMEYHYLLAPQRKGDVKINSFEVNVAGKIYRTKEIHIDVIGSGGGLAAKRGQKQDRGADPNSQFYDLLKEREKLGQGYRSLPRNSKEAFFVQVEVDKTEVFEGGQILARWYVYSRGQIEHIDRLKFPTLRGFWKEDIEAAPALSFRQEVINGVIYRKALLASHALFPISPGTAKIDPYKVKAVVRLNSGSFGLFAFGKPYSYTKTSESVKIKVNPLPLDNRPPDFSGAVGQFEMGATVDGRQFPVGQPFSLKIRLEGRGNAKLIDLPPIDLPPELELYDTKQEARFFKNGTSFKDFEVLLIPRQAGQVVIPGVTTSVFNPDTQEYEQKVSQPIAIQILPSKNQEKIADQNFEETAVATQVVADKPRLPTLKVAKSEMGRVSPPVLFGGWAAAFFAVFALLFWKARTELGWGKVRFNLRKIVDERFVSVSKKIEAGSWRDASSEMANLLYAVIGEMAGLGGASEEVVRMIDKLPPSVRREVGEPLLKHVDKIQVLSFAPEAVVGELREKQQLKAFAKEVQDSLRRAIRLYDRSDDGAKAS